MAQRRANGPIWAIRWSKLAVNKWLKQQANLLLSGEATLLLDHGEVALKPFDVVVQRGTNHAWTNKGREPALIAAVLIDAKDLWFTVALFAHDAPPLQTWAARSTVGARRRIISIV